MTRQNLFFLCLAYLHLHLPTLLCNCDQPRTLKFESLEGYTISVEVNEELEGKLAMGRNSVAAVVAVVPHSFVVTRVVSGYFRICFVVAAAVVVVFVVVERNVEEKRFYCVAVSLEECLVVAASCGAACCSSAAVMQTRESMHLMMRNRNSLKLMRDSCLIY